MLLACEGCHEEIDDQLVTGVLDVDKLTQLKRDHEERIRHLVTLPQDHRTLILRVVGHLRGDALELTRATAVETVLAGTRRFPWFALSFDRLGVEVDLRPLPGGREADQTYYAAARKAIDEVLDTRLRDAISSEEVRHVSVFAFARLPVLIYLGSKLDDTFEADVYQRHRDNDSWQWDEDAPEHSFTMSRVGTLGQGHEAVLVLNVSGVVDERQLPADLADLPRIVLRPDVTPGVDVMRSRRTLDAYTRAVREIYAELDAHKNVKRLHLFAATPVSAAVQLGRARDPHVHPVLIVHDRTRSGAYQRALEIS